MYPSIRTPDVPRSEDRGERPDRRGWWHVGPNVIALGMTSLVTDISSEMVNSIIPLYLVFQLRMSPLAFGVFNGVYEGVAGVMRIAGGLISDRRKRYKEVAGVGYGVSAGAKLGLLVVGQAAVPATTVLVLDRIGKGFRTAPRDALISLSAPLHRLAEAFGVHRALDTTGALLGPVAAYFILAAAPTAYDAVFVISFLFAILGIGVLVCFVRNRAPQAGALRERVQPSARAAFRLLHEPGFRSLFIAAILLSLVTVSDAFIYLTFQERSNLTTKYFPLLYVGTALVYLLLAIPLGRLADRVGRSRVFLTGYLALGGVYILLLMPSPGGTVLIGVLALLGTYYASTDGILAAMASTVVPAELRTSGLAILTTATALATFGASVLFGAWWEWHGPVGSVQLFGVLLGVALIAGWFLFRSTVHSVAVTSGEVHGD
ncbi:MAG TPA: MFS transporter [Acidimicrobiia bacterium]